LGRTRKITAGLASRVYNDFRWAFPITLAAGVANRIPEDEESADMACNPSR